MMLGLSRSRHDRAPRHRIDRGRDARRPGAIPRAGWKDILARVWSQQAEDNISIVAAGVAYYALFAIFPAIAALVSLYGLVADPQQVQDQMAQLGGVLPEQALSVLETQARSVAGASGQGLSWGVALGLLVALWGASRGVGALVTALNIAYDEEETRGFLRLALRSVGLTLAGILFVILTLGLIVAVPAAISLLGLQGWLAWTLALARWPILAAAVLAALAVLYRYGPDRARARWEWVTWGAVAATVGWLLGSIAFSVYVANFGDYNETYGSVGAVVVLLLWFYLSAYVVLMGAELNAEIERQTAIDTTEGPPLPLGRRDAHVADTVDERRRA